MFDFFFNALLTDRMMSLYRALLVAVTISQLQLWKFFGF